MYNTSELKVELIRMNLSRTQLATALNINKSTLSKKINGQSEWTLAEIQKIGTLLGKEKIVPIFFENFVS